jgi:hypothetical protein
VLSAVPYLQPTAERRVVRAQAQLRLELQRRLVHSELRALERRLEAEHDAPERAEQQRRLQRQAPDAAAQLCVAQATPGRTLTSPR